MINHNLFCVLEFKNCKKLLAFKRVKMQYLKFETRYLPFEKQVLKFAIATTQWSTTKFMFLANQVLKLIGGENLDTKLQVLKAQQYEQHFCSTCLATLLPCNS